MGEGRGTWREEVGTFFSAVLFDLDDTLYDQALAFDYAVRAVVGDVPGAGAGALYEASRRHSARIFEAFASGRRPTMAEYAERMQATLAEFGVALDRERACELQRFYAEETAPAMRLSPAMKSALSLCSERGARLGIITNGREGQQRDKVRVLGLSRWVSPGDVFVSEPLGVAKPDPRIFDLACDGMGVAVNDALYVGDAYATDVVGARAAGMPVVWLNRRRRPRPEGGPSPSWEVFDDEGLLDLVRRLG